MWLGCCFCTIGVVLAVVLLTVGAPVLAEVQSIWTTVMSAIPAPFNTILQWLMYIALGMLVLCCCRCVKQMNRSSQSSRDYVPKDSYYERVLEDAQSVKAD